VTAKDWVAWHESYDDPESPLYQRLDLVQGRIRDALDEAPPGEIPLLSMCAGQGRDLLGVLPDHPRRDDVRAVLVELDPDNAGTARESARALDKVRVVTGDAGHTGAYADVVPVQLALVCGVFGNISEPDIRHTIEQLPTLCRPGATVLWTRHRGAPDATPMIRECFATNGFVEIGFDGPASLAIGVGANRMVGPARDYRDDVRLFEFLAGDQGTT
jgi:hypothetical protein